MELFIPSLAFLLFGVAIAYFLLPMAAPMILICGSAVVLAFALWAHWSKFGRMEYEQATWQHNLKKYTSYVLIGAIILGAYGFYAMNQAGNSTQSVVPAVITAPVATPPLPPITVPAIGGGLNSVMKTASSRINELMRHGRISN